jgi:hypothetical protein
MDPLRVLGYKVGVGLCCFANVTESLTNTAIMGIFKAPNLGDGSDPIVTRMVEQDKVPWYKKPNLRGMYFYLFIVCMGVEMTSGFDSQLINTLQFSVPFNKCKFWLYHSRCTRS